MFRVTPQGGAKVRFKVCGLTSEAQVEEAAEAGAGVIVVDGRDVGPEGIERASVS